MAETELTRQRAAARLRLAQARQQQLELSQPVQSSVMQTGLARLSELSRGINTPERAPNPNAGMVIDERKPEPSGVAGAIRGVREAVDGAGNAVLRGATLGLWDDEARAGLASLFGYDYDENLERERAAEEEFKQNNPVANTALEVAGGLAVPGIGAAGKVAQASTRLGRVGAAAATGAASGATYGFMEGEGAQDRLVNAGATAALGGVFGAAAPKVADTLTSIPRGVQRLLGRAQERPTVQNLRAAKNAAYRAVEQAGEVFDGDEMTGLSQRVQAIADSDVGYVPGEDTAVDAALRTLTRREGQDTTLSQLDRIRQRLWSRVSRNPDQVQIYDFIGAIDDVIESRAGSSELMAAARQANATFAKSELLENAFQRAQDRTASTGSGGNLVNKYRQAVESIINNPRKSRFFNDAEIDLMRGFVRGSGSENLRRLIGKLSPEGNGLMLVFHTIGGMASNGATLPLMVVGGAARRSAERAAMRGADQIQDVLAGFASPSRPQLSQPGVASLIASSPQAEDAQAALRGRQTR